MPERPPRAFRSLKWQVSFFLAGSLCVVVALFSAVLLVLAIVLPISAYAAQKWAHRCYLELETLNRTINEFTRYVIEQEYAEKEGGEG